MHRPSYRRRLSLASVLTSISFRVFAVPWACLALLACGEPGSDASPRSGGSAGAPDAAADQALADADLPPRFRISHREGPDPDVPLPTVGEAWTSAEATEGNVTALAFIPTGSLPEATTEGRVLVAGAEVGGGGAGGPGAGGIRTLDGSLEAPASSSVSALAVHQDLVFAADPAEARVHVLRLPGLEPVAEFGEGVLTSPRAMDLLPLGSVELDLLVADRVPSGSRVHRFRLSLETPEDGARHVTEFGDGPGASGLQAVEFLRVETDGRVVLLPDSADGAYKIYWADGRYAGDAIDLGILGPGAHPGGMVLWPCGPATGYWISTERREGLSRFHLLERHSLNYVGGFQGSVTANTGAVDLAMEAVVGLGRGAFFALHEDRAVSAFRLEDIARALSLPDSCLP